MDSVVTNLKGSPFTFDNKWGDEEHKKGFLMIPNALLKHQCKLKLSSPELVTLLNVLMHWYTAENLPFPSPQRLAKRMGISRRTVERHLSSLANEGHLKKVKNSEGRICYDPSALVECLQKFGPERAA